jgi:hypothetical protein
LQKIIEETGLSPALALRNYEGKYKSELQVWKGHNLVPSILRNALASLISGTSVETSFKANYIAL